MKQTMRRVRNCGGSGREENYKVPDEEVVRVTSELAELFLFCGIDFCGGSVMRVQGDGNYRQPFPLVRWRGHGGQDKGPRSFSAGDVSGTC
ncbi:hypothetical protein C0Q70_05197 [Pomacea canaliculata]|uniref:Uncharacterized protein n=1 Tax=Pomacea canaliculata TaxID=400727 RepID=A0A2T7PKH2_POMCA|nr:hypothetical protein C0Q70_05197 [Pomacea canaliculata]